MKIIEVVNENDKDALVYEQGIPRRLSLEEASKFVGDMLGGGKVDLKKYKNIMLLLFKNTGRVSFILNSAEDEDSKKDKK